MLSCRASRVSPLARLILLYNIKISNLYIEVAPAPARCWYTRAGPTLRVKSMQKCIRIIDCLECIGRSLLHRFRKAEVTRAPPMIEGDAFKQFQIVHFDSFYPNTAYRPGKKKAKPFHFANVSAFFRNCGWYCTKPSLILLRRNPALRGVTAAVMISTWNASTNSFPNSRKTVTSTLVAGVS